MQQNKENSSFTWFYFLIAFAFSWLVWSPGIFSTLGLIELPVPFIVFFFIGTWGPFLAASWAIHREGGGQRVREFWRNGFRFGFPGVWFLVLVLLALLPSAVPLGLHIWRGGPGPEQTLLSTPWMIFPVFLTYFITGGGNEEWGWRGYALDKFQRRWNPTAASLILGIIWGCWHIPLFFVESTGQYHMSLLVFILATPGLSVLHTWVYNKTGRSLMAAWLFHALIGTFWEVFPIVQPGLGGYEPVYIYDFIATALLALVVILIDGTSLGYKAASG